MIVLRPDVFLGSRGRRSFGAQRQPAKPIAMPESRRADGAHPDIEAADAAAATRRLRQGFGLTENLNAPSVTWPSAERIL